MDGVSEWKNQNSEVEQRPQDGYPGRGMGGTGWKTGDISEW